ncbi:hypothetical protein BDR03DRAFT_974181 [Suillus americanus]|nr:hypothetical protein BDR03DRAFT_974181 [Suillus americanus]
MSGIMIPSGVYLMCNKRYTNRYVCMSGDNDVVGNDVGDSIKVEVIDENQRTATFYDTQTGLYLGIDQTTAKVKGYTDPQVLQLSAGSDRNNVEIHLTNGNDVWSLNDVGTSTPIIVQPVRGSDKQYWMFIKAAPE